jgi:hypothetical protein
MSMCLKGFVLVKQCWFIYNLILHVQRVVEVVVGKNTTPLLTDAQPLLSGQVLMVCQLQ